MTMKYGRTWHVGNYLIITTPENVEHVLKTNFDNYNKGPIFILNFHDLLGDGFILLHSSHFLFLLLKKKKKKKIEFLIQMENLGDFKEKQLLESFQEKHFPLL